MKLLNGFVQPSVVMLVWCLGCGGEKAPSGSSSAPQIPAAAAGTAAPVAGTGPAGTGAAAMTATAGRGGTSAAPPASGTAGTTTGAAGSGVAGAAAGAGTGAAGTTGLAAGSGGAAGGTAGSGSAGGPALPVPTEKFSFFVTSLKGMRDLSKNDQGFGGDLRYGEATGLAGADKICTELAERSMPGAGGKVWHAFLSTEKGGANDGPVHAKDRIGTGPWYDRLGRLVAMNLAGLLQNRPMGADPAIVNDLPNERGEPNKTDTVMGMEDNHDTVTGTNAQGMWDGTMTCKDWTSHDTPQPMGAAGSGGGGMAGRGGGFPGGMMFMLYGPRVGHSWPAQQSGVSWFAAHRAPGCSPSVSLVQTGAGMGTGIGNGGGYGGIYCFAMKP